MSLLEVLFLLLLCLSPATDQQETTVKPGDDATLQCHCPSDAASKLLEWFRLDQKSDRCVFFYRNNRLLKQNQHPSFRGRVELRDPEMKGGDVSVILKNVTVNDAGTYRCQIISRETENGERTTSEFSSNVSLTVTDSGPSDPHKLAAGNEDEGNTGGGNEDGRNIQKHVVLAVCGTVVGLLLIIGVVFISYKLMNKHTCVSYQQAPVKTEAVSESFTHECSHVQLED